MNDPETVQMAQALGNLVQDSRHVALARLSEITEHTGPLNDVGKGGLAEFEGDVKESGRLLLSEIPDDCDS